MRLNLIKTKIILTILLFFATSFSPLNSQSLAVHKRHKTVVIYIIGLAGTGKYTIAKKISNRGYKLVDNHLINNPIFSLLGKDGARRASEGATKKITRIRNIVLEFSVEDSKANYIFTNQLLNNGFHQDIYSKILETAHKRNSIFVPVVLTISSSERARRIVQPERAARFKITDANEAYRSKKILNVSHQNLMQLDVTHLSADQAADQIMKHVQKVMLGSPP